MDGEHVCSIDPIEFEKYCLEILKGYAEEEGLKEFTIVHDEKIPADDGVYQIDIYAEFTAMRAKFKVLCECKRYNTSVSREKVAVLHQKIQSLGAQKGILLSTSDFQSGAIQYAKAHGIALIRVDDYHFEYLSHSSGKNEISEDDPFYYAERHMPPYVAYDYTASEDEPVQVYPTGSRIRALIIEMYNRVKEEYKSSISLPDIEDIVKNMEDYL